VDEQLSNLVKELEQAILAGSEEEAIKLTKKAVERITDQDSVDLISCAIQPALNQIGDKFQSGDIYLPELMLSGYAAQAAIEIILSLVPSLEGVQKGTVVIGTPSGDMHDIGKNIVGALLTAYGYKLVDLGVDVSPNEFVRAAQKEKAEIIATSTLLSTCLPYQREIINLLKDMNCREDFYVICGGGPVTPEWVSEIKADGYGREANDAVSLCNALMSHQIAPPLASPQIYGALKKKSVESRF
jgi:methylmalonyl-CoA mutase cobalamin-binding domain/chain